MPLAAITPPQPVLPKRPHPHTMRVPYLSGLPVPLSATDTRVVPEWFSPSSRPRQDHGSPPLPFDRLVLERERTRVCAFVVVVVVVGKGTIGVCLCVGPYVSVGVACCPGGEVAVFTTEGLFEVCYRRAQNAPRPRKTPAGPHTAAKDRKRDSSQTAVLHTPLLARPREKCSQSELFCIYH